MHDTQSQSLAGQVILVTGGATGIGRGICEALALQGARLAIMQPDVSQARQAANSYAGSRGFAADIRDPLQVQVMMDAVIAEFGYLDGLVNNASVTGDAALGSFATMARDQVDRIIDTNLKGAIWCSQVVAQWLISMRRPGGIVNIASVGAFAAQEMASAYCATKAAQVSLTQSMALELAQHQIRVNAVAPGDILTERSADMPAHVQRLSGTGKYLRQTPLGRRGLPIEIGYAVAFLLSPEAAFITGTTLKVDGGFTAY